MPGAGKGSTYRRVDLKKYDSSWNKNFGVHCPYCYTIMDKLAGVHVCMKCGYRISYFDLNKKEVSTKY